MFKRPFRRHLSLALVLALVLMASFGSSGQAAAAGETDLGRAIAAQEAHTDALMAIDGVIGTAVGRGTGGGHIVLALTTAGGIPGIPGAVDGVIVRPYVTGEITALKGKPGGIDRTAKFDRPVPIGVSTGHPDITAGTIGARVTDGTNVYALSNNHVYADENNASIGNAVIQPGTYDGGSSPADDIGTLDDFEPIVFSTSANNVIDAAVALTTTDDLNNATPSDGYGTPASATATAAVGMNVMKYGRTTGETKSQISGINVTVNIGYDSGTARFVGQVLISGGKFSDGGDSGSLIVTESGLNPVALLYAGSKTTTIGNPIDAVLARFGVTIDGTGSPPAPADTGSILGNVTDDSSPAIAVAGATVSTGTGQSATTDGSGDYVISGVPVGSADVTASKAGFVTSSPASVDVIKDEVTSGTNFALVALDLGTSTVASITFVEKYRGPNTDLIFTIEITEPGGGPAISGATVSGVLFREGRSWPIGGVTDSSGLYSGKLRSARVGTEYTVRVDTVTHAGFIYDDPDPAASASHLVVGP
ncbi:MAG: carboxypeptidase regulatory-like domain-containing protein [Chloroflexi bacterium]|nr:carboxypeptidase regulatory-like domain-containing protein [Chloroflexota bacterium]